MMSKSRSWTKPGDTVVVGETGEIVARGSRMMAGYWEGRISHSGYPAGRVDLHR